MMSRIEADECRDNKRGEQIATMIKVTPTHSFDVLQDLASFHRQARGSPNMVHLHCKNTSDRQLVTRGAFANDPRASNLKFGLVPSWLIVRSRRLGRKHAERVARGGESVDTHVWAGKGLVRRFLSGGKRSEELVDNRAS